MPEVVGAGRAMEVESDAPEAPFLDPEIEVSRTNPAEDGLHYVPVLPEADPDLTTMFNKPADLLTPRTTHGLTRTFKDDLVAELVVPHGGLRPPHDVKYLHHFGPDYAFAHPQDLEFEDFEHYVDYWWS